MNEYDYDYEEPTFEQPLHNQESTRFRANPRRFKKLRLNRMKARLRKPITATKRLPTRKKQKEMSLRRAKQLIFGGRTPGRPSKTLSNQLREAKRVLQAAGEPIRRKTSRPTGRSRGRPKKLVTVKKEKRPRGRPRKNPTVTNKVKRPRGRPKKIQLGPPKIKKPRGRPRKNPLQQLVESPKKPRQPKNDA